MKIGDVLKRSWAIVWRYKILWLFGLFAAEAGSAGFNGNFGNSFNSNNFGGSGQASQFGYEFSRFLTDWWPVLVGAGVFLLLVGIVWWILSIAARGGLIVLSDDAAEGREVHGSRGWSMGFHYWGRVFLQGLVFALPILLLAFVFALVILLVAGGSIAAIISGSSSDRGGLLAGGIVGLVAGFCGLAAVFFIFVLAISLLYAVLRPVSLRYAILHDRPAIKAIGDGWRLVRSRLGKVALVAVTLWGLGIVFGIGLFIVIILFAIPIAIAAFAKMWAFVGLIAFILFVALVFAGAVWSAYYSTTWTVAFRDILAIDDAEKAGTAVVPPTVPPAPPAETAPVAPVAAAAEAPVAETAPIAPAASPAAPAEAPAAPTEPVAPAAPPSPAAADAPTESTAPPAPPEA